MAVLRSWPLHLDADAVLRAQGADPARLRARGSAAVAAAEEALAEGLPLLEPAVVCERLRVAGVQHRKLRLGDDGRLRVSGPLVGRHLGSAREVVAIVCTVGGALEGRVSERMANDPVRAYALDALGSAAVDQLGDLACARVEERAAADGLRTTMPLSPGLIGWPLDTGQRQLFALVDAEAIGVRLTAGSLMTPRKSTSLVIGVGAEVLRDGEPCDYCTLRETCSYRAASA